MDLHIEKHEKFHENGRICTKTYVKPNYKPQFLAYQSQHKSSVKKCIFRNEAYRHMINCSSESDYLRLTERVAQDLRARGYPSHMLCPPPYSEEHRQEFFRKLHARQPKSTKKLDDNTLTYVSMYSSAQRGVRIQREIHKLLGSLRTELGAAFLPNPNVIIANKIAPNLFLRSHALNFTEHKWGSDHRQRQMRFSMRKSEPIAVW